MEDVIGAYQNLSAQHEFLCQMRNLITEAIKQNKYGVCKSDFYPGIFLNSSDWVTKNGRKPFIQWCPGSPGNGQIIKIFISYKLYGTSKYDVRIHTVI